MYKLYIKRIIDFIISFMVCLILFPVFILIIIVLFFTNKKSGIFFTQERPGKNAKIFKVIKFKSMTDERNKDGSLLPDKDRLTRVGEFIRKTSLDEIPQLINVLKGDMSFVGPRPLLPVYLNYYTEEEKKRHNVRPGITGLAQVQGRNNLCWDIRLKLDVFYVRKYSFKMDLAIFIKTIKIVLKRENVLVVPGLKYLPLHIERGNGSQNN